MSCNPAIGGLGKGHLVREIDALDGLMGRVADRGGIQFRVLNRRKGPAVRGPRAQADRALYAAAMQAGHPRRRPNLEVIEAEADDLIDRGTVASPACGFVDGRALAAGAVVLTTGTFLRGLIHIGEQQIAGRPGRRGAGASAWRSPSSALGFALGRLKTGTPPRLDGRTIDWGAVEMQPGDEPPEPFSTLTERIENRQIPAASPAPPPPPTTSSAPMCTARRCIPARSQAAGRAIARRSRTRSSASASATAIRSSWSPKGSTIRPSIRTAFRPRCRKTSSAPSSPPFRAWNRPA